MWCDSTDHVIATCPRHLKAVTKGVVKPLAPPQQIQEPQKPAVRGRAYIMSKKEASNYGTIVIGTLLLNLQSFFILFDSGATHSFISSRAALLLNLEGNKEELDYRISLLNEHVTKCSILYRDVPILIEKRDSEEIIYNLSYQSLMSS